MSGALRIAGNSTLELPLDAVTRTFGIYGQRGTGKTNTAVVMVEQMVRAGARVCVIDPKGDWWGITRAGEGRGLPGIVLGGDYGDVPLEEQAGSLVAELVTDRHWPVVVLDISGMRKGARRRFLADFLEKLYDLNRQALHVVFEEAHQALPQMTRREGSGQEVVLNRVIGAAEDIVTLGRKRGLGTSIVSQRFATVNATVREQVETLLLHRLSGPLDRKAAEGWIKTNGDPELTTRLLNEIAGYKLGEALLYSPGWLGLHERLKIKSRKTFDSSATPEVGEEAVEPTERAPVDLDELRERMADTVERVKANDPAELRKRLAVMKRELDEAKDGSYEAGYEAGYAKRAELKEEPELVEVAPPNLKANLKTAAAELARQAQGTQALAIRLGEEADELPDQEGKPRPVPPARPPMPTPVTPARSRPRVPQREEPPVNVNGDIPPARQRILDALASLAAVGVHEPGRTQLALFSKVSPKSSGYANNLGALRSAGLIDYPPGKRVRLTAGGEKLARAEGAPTTTEELHRYVQTLLPPARWVIVQELITGYPSEYDKEELANVIGVSPKSSGYANNLGALKSLGLVEYPGRGTVAAAPVLFLGDT